MQIESYRTRIEAFGQDLNGELYRAYSGAKDRLELKAVYSDHSDLLSVESIHDVLSALDNAEESFSSRRKSLRKIHEFLIDQHLDYRAASLNEEADTISSQQTFTWEGRPVVPAQVPSLINNEPDAEKRRHLSERYAGVLSQSEGIVRNRIALLQSTAAALGFKDYVRAREYVAGIDYAGLLDAVDAALSRTDDGYLERMRVSIEATLGIPLQEAGAWDVSRWRALNDPAHFFPEKNLLPVINAAISDLGVRPENSEAISFDLDSPSKKRFRPCCIPIRVPDEIKVVMRPESGSHTYAALLHESGHACHFAWTGRSLPIEHRAWGDRALSEAYAFLFERLLLEPDWLARTFSFIKSESFLRFRRLYRLFLVRRCAGRLRFALRLWQAGSVDEMPHIYADTMKSCTGLRHQAGAWLANTSDGFEAADYLRGWILECMLREYVRTRYGTAWMQSRAAAGFLKEIWETGFIYRAEELAREIGIGNLDPHILADDLLGGLQS